jgi:hypothetical protein
MSDRFERARAASVTVLPICLLLDPSCQPNATFGQSPHRPAFKGRVLAGVLLTVGKRTLGSEFGKTVKAIEARNYGASAT